MHILTPLPKLPMPGMTFSKAMDCKTRGVPYIAPKQLDIEDTYKPASSKSLTADTLEVIIKSVSNALRVHVAPRNIINTKYKNVPVPIAANVPLGILTEGARKSPLMLIPDNTPVTVGKKTPNMVNQLYPSS